ncbi:MAG: hypothetical protein HKN70_10235 [Gammaproteobacteria bacterium]|nr:hypothetical protein [Gammaproteobacteria bacterium]
MTKLTLSSMPLLLALNVAVVPAGAEDLSTTRETIGAGPNLAIDCKTLERAHSALVNGCFSTQRAIAITLNNKPVRTELARVHNVAGEITVDVIEQEVLDKRIEIDGQGDMVVESTFSCERMTRNAEGLYELESADDPQRITFELDEDNDVLLPLRWEFEEKARFLFKKFHIQAHADYSEVTLHSCDAE